MSLDLDRIHKPIRKLRKFVKKAPKKPRPEEIHDLRTNSRRLETEVEVFGLSSKANEREAAEALLSARNNRRRGVGEEIVGPCRWQDWEQPCGQAPGAGTDLQYAQLVIR